MIAAKVNEQTAQLIDRKGFIISIPLQADLAFAHGIELINSLCLIHAAYSRQCSGAQ